MNDLLTTRAVKPEDEAFIYSTWLRGLYFGNAWFRQISKVDYFEKYRKVIEYLLKTAKVTIVCLIEDPEVIVAYSVASPDNSTLHWLYVKRNWRGQGIGKGLVPTNVEKVTHLTEKAAEKIKAKGLKFDPLIT